MAGSPDGQEVLVGAPEGAAPGRWWTYENKLLATLSVAEASMFVDRLALGILTPFLLVELKLSNFQVGLLASVFSLSYALAGYVGGWASDRSGQRRVFLLMHVLAFSLLSGATGLAWGFLPLLAIRLVLGFAEGPVLPLLQSVMIPASSPGRKAFNAAFLMNVAPFIAGQFAAPIVLTHLASAFDWRVTFFLTAIPGLLILPFIARLVRDAERPARTAAQATAPTTSLVRNRNLMLCVGMAACTGTWIYMINTFLPLYLTRIAGYSPITMGYATSLLGVGGCAASLVLPALSDRIGRKPVLLIGFALGLLVPLAVLLAADVQWALMAGILVGSAMLGITPLTITLVPSDSVPTSDLARAIGLTSASSAIVGGMVMTAIAGRAADAFGLQAPFAIACAALLLAGVFASALRPTPPAHEARD